MKNKPVPIWITSFFRLDGYDSDKKARYARNLGYEMNAKTIKQWYGLQHNLNPSRGNETNG